MYTWITTRSGRSSRSRGCTCSSTREISIAGSRYAASVARPSGGNNEYLIGRQNGPVASVSAGRIILTVRGRGMPVPPGPSRARREVGGRAGLGRTGARLWRNCGGGSGLRLAGSLPLQPVSPLDRTAGRVPQMPDLLNGAPTLQGHVAVTA